MHEAGTLAQQLPELLPLAVTGAACLVGLGLTAHESRNEAPAQAESSSSVRWVIVALLFVASMAHVPEIPLHLDEAPYMGVLFIGYALATYGLAATLTLRPSEGVYLAAGLLCAAAAGAFVATRLVEFPSLAHDVGNWAEPLGVVSLVAEIAVVGLVGWSGQQPSLTMPGHRSAHPRSVTSE